MSCKFNVVDKHERPLDCAICADKYQFPYPFCCLDECGEHTFCTSCERYLSMKKDNISAEDQMKIDNFNECLKNKSFGSFSDGYHTFDELYHHRAVLFAVICNIYKDKAWKSKKHDTGDMYDGMFIVGIETPEGPATYHYDIDPYWDMFDVKEIPNAPKWDGHTPTDAINRIQSLMK